MSVTFSPNVRQNGAFAKFKRLYEPGGRTSESNTCSAYPGNKKIAPLKSEKLAQFSKLRHNCAIRNFK